MAEEFKDTSKFGNKWHTDLEQFMADLFDAKKNLAKGYWCMDADVKYINIRIDTRDLGYIIHADGRGDSSNMKNKFFYLGMVLVLLLIGGSRYNPNSTKIDRQAVDGLLGTADSLAYKVDTLNRHNHSRERWFGISGNQSGNDWATDTLTPFVAISGADTYGTDHAGGAGAVDEAYVIGTDDMPGISGMVQSNAQGRNGGARK